MMSYFEHCDSVEFCQKLDTGRYRLVNSYRVGHSSELGSLPGGESLTSLTSN